MDKISKENKMIKKRIQSLINKFGKYKIDGYVIPKHDEFFSEYSENDRLKTISNFSGSAGYSIILRNNQLSMRWLTKRKKTKKKLKFKL